MLPEELKKLRRKNGLSQIELAEELNVSRQAVSRWERGDAFPSVENLKCLSGLFHVSVDDLLGDGKDAGTLSPEPEPAGPPPETRPAETGGGAAARPHSAVWAVVLSAAALLVSVVTLILLLTSHPAAPKEPTAPLIDLDGSAVMIGEDGKPIEGERIDGYTMYTFALEPVEYGEDLPS